MSAISPTMEALGHAATAEDAGEARKTGRKATRVQLELPPRSMDRLHKLKERTEAASYTEVLKNALRLYEAMLAEAEAGREFYIREPNGSLSPYRIFVEA